MRPVQYYMNVYDLLGPRLVQACYKFERMLRGLDDVDARLRTIWLHSYAYAFYHKTKKVSNLFTEIQIYDFVQELHGDDVENVENVEHVDE